MKQDLFVIGMRKVRIGLPVCVVSGYFLAKIDGVNLSRDPAYELIILLTLICIISGYQVFIGTSLLVIEGFTRLISKFL